MLRELKVLDMTTQEGWLCGKMPNILYLLVGSRGGFKMGEQRLIDGIYNDGMIDALTRIFPSPLAYDFPELGYNE